MRLAPVAPCGSRLLPRVARTFRFGVYCFIVGAISKPLSKALLMKNHSLKLVAGVLLFVRSMTNVYGDEVRVVLRPDISETNSNYVSNKKPLQPLAFIPLPVGSVEPSGWLLEMLKRQRSGLTGHLGEISAWLQKKDNAWLSKNGKGKYGWEELPYWLKGYIELAYIFNDPDMIAESHTWIEGALASQRADGDFGPDERFSDDGSRDYWANMIMLYCLQSYYDHTGDQRVIDLMSRYFKYQMSVSDDKMLTHYWQKMRGGDNIQAIHWLYNRTGDAELLKLVEKIHRCTADWRMRGDLPNWHNVNIAECFREPAQLYLQTGNPADLRAAYANHFEVRRRYGQVPGGMFGGDENCRVGFDDPRQAVETCGMVEQMLSDAMMMQISGDPFWADHCEQVAFNCYPAAVMPDFKSLRYLTAPNMVVADSKNHAPGIDNNGPFLVMNPFSSRCCQHNHSHGWPYFTKHLWMVTPDNGVCAAMYSASTVNVKVADGKSVKITEETKYPFEDTITFRVSLEQQTSFPLYLRIPAWCEAPEVAINGVAVSLPQSEKAGSKVARYVQINRAWRDGNTVKLRLPMKLGLEKWEDNHNSVSVNYGPLAFSLKIGERYDQKDSAKTAIGDSSWQEGADPAKWPAWEIHPTTPWNYGLVLSDFEPGKLIAIQRSDWPKDDFPFTPDAAPITLTVGAKRIPQWTLDRYGLCAVLQDSPAKTESPYESVTLIPMGAARLRISAFPTVSDGPDAHVWTESDKPLTAKYEATASFCNSNDSLTALSDGVEPRSSGDQSIPRMTWWDHRGSSEWVRYDFPQSKTVDSVSVYWFDDTGVGQCRVPKSWRLLYKKGDQWQAVETSDKIASVKDAWNTIKFKPVSTVGLRLEVELQSEFSGGILEWRVNDGEQK